MIKDLLKVKNCFIKESVKDWEDAICVACAPVIEQGYCTKEYEDAVFENTEKFGPYYVLCENLALIHASNQSGVNETQMAVSNIFADESKVNSLLNASTPQEIYNIFVENVG